MEEILFSHHVRMMRCEGEADFSTAPLTMMP